MSRNHAYPTKKMSTIVVFQVSVHRNTRQSVVYVGFVCLYAAQQISFNGTYTARTLSDRSSVQNTAEEELAHHVVGNDSGMYKAGFAGDDAPHSVPFGHDCGM